MAEEAKELTAEEQIVELKKQLAVARRKTTNAEKAAEVWKLNYETLKDYHEGPNEQGQNRERYAEERAKQNIEREWPAFARALAMYVDPQSYSKLRTALPQRGETYSGLAADTAYNKFIDLIDTELYELWNTIKHKYERRT